MGQSEILRLDAVTRQFAKHLSPAVNQVSFTLQPGELLALLGESGCGKTTLLRLIAGFEQPQSGTIELNGQVVAGQGQWLTPERRDVGMVFQDYALFPHLTVAKNVAFGLTQPRRTGNSRYSPQKLRELVADAIALVSLQGLEDRYPHQLSGGQQQRVALARALAPRPALILLDEPLSNLDAQVRLRLREEIRTVLKATGTSAVFVTHDQEEALSIADQIAVMRHGCIEQLDTPEALYQHPASRFVAEFVTQANFLPAFVKDGVLETEVGYFSIQNTSEIQNRLTEAHERPKFKIQNGSRAELMIRQEDLHLEPDDSASVVIRDRQFLGREHRYCLLTPSGQELHARTTYQHLLPAGTRVKLSVAESALQIFPYGDERFLDKQSQQKEVKN